MKTWQDEVTAEWRQELRDLENLKKLKVWAENEIRKLESDPQFVHSFSLRGYVSALRDVLERIK